MPESRQTLEAMAEEIFELSKLVSTARSRRQTGPDDLSESEFLALDMLARHEPQTIGEIQKQIGVVPAQMSRIVRALESRAIGSYIRCSINPQDRRRIDVCLTDAGRQAHTAYRTSRLGSMLDILTSLPPDDRVHFMRIMRQIRHTMAARLGNAD